MAARAGRQRRTDRHSLSSFLSVVDNIVQDVARLMSTDHTNQDYIDSASLRLETMATNIARVSSKFPQCLQLLNLVQSLHTDVTHLKRISTDSAYKARKVNGHMGPPSYNITKGQLEYLLELGFKATDIARLLQVSRSTIMRRSRFFGLHSSQRYSSISDEELEGLIRPMVEENPHLGYRSVQARLRVDGHICQESRVRESLVHIDPAAAALRWSDTIQRRKYQVAGPNSLWHIDGNHKLIRWKFVIHGGIDGFSRHIMFLGVATNNRAETVLQLFISASTKYGIPSRVRADHGGENAEVATFMTLERGPGRSSMMQGKSVHNQRIERLWVDLYQGCTNVFNDLFMFMEEEGILDIENDKHLWALHYVFKPRIERALKIFQNQWNNHKLRTERGKTPRQLFVQGALQHFNSGHAGIADIFNNGDNEIGNDYGIDWDGPVPLDPEHEIEVEDIDSPISDEKLEELRASVSPLNNERNDFGIEAYLNTLTFL